MTTESSSSSSLPAPNWPLTTRISILQQGLFSPLRTQNLLPKWPSPLSPSVSRTTTFRAYSQYQTEAIKRYSRLFRRPDGVFLNIEMSDQEVEDALKAWEKGRREIFGDLEETEETRYVVVSDGEQVLGVGDQGIGGIAIAEAKGLLMTLCGGLHPGVVWRVLHFEDFGVMNARRLLETYREKLPCFNDDVQGTGVVTLGAMMAAAKVTKVDLKENENPYFRMVDKNGLLLESSYDLRPVQKALRKPDSDWQDKDTKDLTNLISIIKPHALIGVSTIKGAFTESAVKEMAKHVERPIIFPLSNPTSLHEAVPEDLIKWTESKALIATGFSFPPVEHDGKRFEIAENNNSVVFPAIGLAARREEWRGMSPALDGEGKALLPDVEQVREVVRDIAVGVVKKAQEEKLVKKQGVPEDEEKLKKWVEERMWKPE
ncbi:hypothetical protein BZA77DRAFT_340199 [Pyronema omphalodes]|nr:hypothetical protein BZA77DRAFT_340199 [Pyronema omphalodes]